MTEDKQCELIVDPGDLASLAKAKPVGIDLNMQYWSPEKPGEEKALMLVGYTISKFPDQNDPSVQRKVPCAVFADQDNQVWQQGSAILISVLRANFIEGDQMVIEYKGVKKSKKGNNCSHWGVRRLEVTT